MDHRAHGGPQVQGSRRPLRLCCATGPAVQTFSRLAEVPITSCQAAPS